MNQHSILLSLIICIICLSCSLDGKQSRSMPAMKEAKIFTNPDEIRHLVFLDVKREVNLDSLIIELYHLSKLESVSSFSIGKYKELNDLKAMSDYELILDMTFTNKKTYLSYQSDSLHQTMISKSMKCMAGPPASFDYQIK